MRSVLQQCSRTRGAQRLLCGAFYATTSNAALHDGIVHPNERISHHSHDHAALKPKETHEKASEPALRMLVQFRSHFPNSMWKTIADLVQNGHTGDINHSYTSQIHCVDIVVGSEGRAGVELAKCANFAVTSIEADISSMNRTFSYAAKRDAQIELVPASVEESVIENDSADVVTIFHGLHLLNIPEALKEMHRILKPNKYLVVAWNDRDLSSPLVQDLEERLEKNILNYNRYQKQHDVDEWSYTLEEGGLFKMVGYFVKPNPMTLPSTNAFLDLIDSMSFVRSHVHGSARKRLHEDLLACLYGHGVGEDGGLEEKKKKKKRQSKKGRGGGSSFEIPIESKCFILRKADHHTYRMDTHNHKTIFSI